MKIKIIICLLLYAICGNAQRLVEYKEVMSFHYPFHCSSSGFRNILPPTKYYTPSYELARDTAGYYFILLMKNSKQYDDINDYNSCFATLTCSDGQQISLYKYEGESIVRWANSRHQNGPYPNSEWQLVDFYGTMVIYRINDIDDFMSHTYVGLDFLHGMCAIDMNKENPKFIKKFNRSLQEAKKMVEREYSGYLRNCIYNHSDSPTRMESKSGGNDHSLK